MRVKGKCHEVFDPLFFCLKHSFVALNEWAKTVQIYSITKFEIPESAKSTVHSHGILAPIIFFFFKLMLRDTVCKHIQILVYLRVP